MARSIVGEIYLNVLPIDGGVTPGVQRIIDGAQNRAVEVPVGADTAQAEAAVGRLAGSIESGIGAAWQSAAVQAATFTASILAARAAIEGTVGKLAGLFDQLAQAQAGFTAILGSESAGNKLLDDIREFARVSPFVTQELVNYSQQLLGVGQAAESIVPLLRSTGDLIASVGGDTQNISRVLFTLTQIRSIGRLVGQDAIQLQSALVPITKLLADFLGKTTAEVKKLQEQGAISADTVFAAITAAGGKVEGAMNNATRNISGARSVLQDTVTIMFQDTEILTKVFEDLVAGILSFSNALGENEQLQADIATIDRALTSLYESIQPLIAAFSATSANVALNGLSILASTLEVLANILNAFPESALELIGQGLAVILALKAPLALIRYAQSFAELGKVLTPANTARLAQTALGIERTGQAATRAATGVGLLNVAYKGTATVTDQQVGNVQRLSAAYQRHATVLSGVALAAGLLISNLGKENEALQTIGQTLSTTAIGAQLGMAFGGPGAVIGAGAGLGVGLITSFVGNAREEAQRRTAEAESVGAKIAADIQRGLALTTPTFDSSGDFDNLFEKIAPQADRLAAANEELERLIALREQLVNQSTEVDPDTGVSLLSEPEEYLRGLEEVDAAMKEAQDTATETKRALDLLVTEGPGAERLQDLTTRLTELNNESPGFVETIERFVDANFALEDGATSAEKVLSGYRQAQAEAVLLGQTGITTAAQFALVEEAAKSLGLTVQQFLLLPIDQLIELTDNKMPGSFNKVRLELVTVTTAFDEAKKAADEFFGVFIKNINNAQAAVAKGAALDKAAETLITEQNVSNALAYGDALAQMASQIAAANNAVFENTGNDAGASFLIAQLEALRDELNLNDEAFEALLRQMGLLEAYNTGVNAGFTGNIEQLAETIGLTEERLKELIPSLNTLKSGAEFSIPFTVIDKIEEIELFEARLQGVPTITADAAEAIETDLLQLDFTGGLITPIDLAIDGMARLQLAAAGTFLDMISLIEQVKAAGLDTFALDAAETFLDIEARRAVQEQTDPTFGQQLSDQKSQAAIDQLARQRAAEAIAEKARLEAERIAEEQRREAERLAAEAKREAERIAREAEQAAREAERLAEEQRREMERLQESLKSASETIQSAMDSAAEAISQAAQQWTQGIRERAQDETAVSITRLLRNAGQQAANLDELGRGLQTLQGRGLSSEAADAIGIDNVTDIRQVRRLLQASPDQLAQLSQLIGVRDANAEAIARREEQAQTQATIVAAIIQAAEILGVDLTPEAAQQLSLQFNVTGDSAGTPIPAGIIDQLTNAGLIVRT